MENKVLSLLGLAYRGRNLVSGQEQCLDAVRSGKARLVLVAEDASDNTKKVFLDKCDFYRVPISIFGTKETLAKSIGKEMRSCMCVTDEGLARAILQKIQPS